MPQHRRWTYNTRDVVSIEWARGHKLVQIDDPRQRHRPEYHEDWRYADDGQPAPGNAMVLGTPRPCPSCHQAAPAADPDPCLGWLPGVRNACCGHGVTEDAHLSDAYVQFLNGRTLRGEEAHAYFVAQGCTPPPRKPTRR